MTNKPNILVFMTDDHGQWAANCYGDKTLVTPNMDYLARRGVRMTRAFTPSPVCSPARACFYTGKIPSAHGIHDWLMETGQGKEHRGLDGQLNIGHWLQEAGYQTAQIGKWHCGDGNTPKAGFDRWFSHFDGQYPHLGRQQFSDQGKEVIEYGHQSPFITDQAIHFLDDCSTPVNEQSTAKNKADKQKPWFMFVGYVNTHSPWQDQPRRWVDHYQDTLFDNVFNENFDACHGRPLSHLDMSDVDEQEHRRRLTQYYAAVSSIDDQIGRILDHLDGQGQLDNTLIIYTSDHGHMCGQHGLYSKGNSTRPQNFLEESILVPCLLSWPKHFQEGHVCNKLVDHCDLFQTVLDAAGVVLPTGDDTLVGKSYLSMLQGKEIPWREVQFCEYGNARMIRSDRYKLICRYPIDGRIYGNELYDLQTDPREQCNVIDDVKHRDVVSMLSKQLDDYFSKHELACHRGIAVGEQPACNPMMAWLDHDIAGLQ